MATVTFYGPLSDIMGRTRAVEIGAGQISLRSLVDRLAKDHPELGVALERMRVTYARNNVIASPDDFVEDGDDIALLPPFSGG